MNARKSIAWLVVFLTILNPLLTACGSAAPIEVTSAPAVVETVARIKSLPPLF